jgi:hypothetical protein
MNKTSLTTLIALLTLTLLSVLCSFVQEKYIGAVILGLSLLKFIGVAFLFMDLRKAHIFWKATLLIFVTLFITLILGIKYL